MLDIMYYSHMNKVTVTTDFSDGMATIRAIMRAASVIEAYGEAKLASVNLSLAKQMALSQLVTAGEPLPLGEIAQRLTCVRSNVTQLVDRLQSDGLVRRVDDPSDRRIIRAELTPLGRELQAQGEQILRAAQQELMARISSAEAAHVVQVLSKIK